MLRKIKLLAELKQREMTLKALLKQKSDFEVRKSDLEKALTEAETEEDIELVEKSIDELETEVKEADADAKSAAEQKKIDEINAELEKLDEQSKTAIPSETPKDDVKERGAVITMRKGILAQLDAQQRADFFASERVKTFLSEARELRQSKGVSNVELTIPQEFFEVLRPNLPKLSKLYSKVAVKKVKGTGRKNISGIYPEAVWTEMCATLNELGLSFNQIGVDGYKVGGFIAIDNALLEDSDEALASEILEALSAAIAKALDRAIIYGTGVRMPLGIATRLAQTAQPSDWDKNAPAWVDLHETHIAKLSADEAAKTGADFFASLYKALTVADSDYASGSLTWVMNKKTHQTLIAKAIAMDSSAAVVSSLHSTMPVIGGDIIELEIMADNDILGGYFDLYLLAERQGGKFASTDVARFIEDQTLYKGTARYDGKPIFGEAFVMLNISNTAPTTVTTFPGDEANVKLVSLSELKIGATPVTLFPPFDPKVLNYTCTVKAHANKVTATALTAGATVSIKNGDTAVNSGSNATFTAGENILTITVSNGHAAERTYTVIVDDATT
jgi:HK97 family phage major capsid protein